MIRKLLFLFVCVVTSVTAWGQEFTSQTSSVVGNPSERSVIITLSGDWLDGTDVTAQTDALINLIMGYDAEAGTFDNTKAYGKVTIKSAGTSTVTVNQSLVRQLITGKAGEGEDYPNGFALEKNYIEYLDLGEIAVTEYVGHDGAASPNENATLFGRNGGVSPVRYFAMPSFDTTVEGQTYSIPAYTTAWMGSLEELILPVNTKRVEAAGFADGTFSKFKLNQGLEFIGNSAFYANSERIDMETLEIPSSVKYIGPDAFFFRVYTDIYFHSAQAPICPVGKGIISGVEGPFLYSICYDGNGGQNTTEGDNYEAGYANRNNYKNGNYWFVMIHFPSSAECPNLDISSYKDATRVYHKVYGTVYGQATNDKETVEIGVAGKEQEYLERKKVWHVVNGHDWVGDETTALTYEGKSTIIEDGSGALVPDTEKGQGYVTSGYEDTYRGLNYIWPSQSQYIRAYVTVSLGYNWDGVTKYRPELSEDQILLMAEDNLIFKDESGNWVNISEMYYTPKSAAEYNENLEGAIHPNGVKETYTQEEAEAYNAPLMVHEGDPIYYTEEEVLDNNATLTVEGAVHEGEVKEEDKILSYDEWIAACVKANQAWVSSQWSQEKYEEAIENAKTNPYEYFPVPYKMDILYTKEEAAELNSNLEGAISTSDVKKSLTADEAAEINANNTDLVAEGDPKTYYTEAEALAHNAGLNGAKEVGDPVEGGTDYSDDLSRIAFQSTRRCVFAANDGGGDNYKVNIPNSKAWWTICLPFDLTKAQIDKYFGVGSHVCLFNQVDRELEPSDGSKPYVKFYFTDDQYSKATSADAVVLQAHVPYMIFPTIDEADAVYLANGIPMDEFYIKTGNPTPTIVTASDGTKYRFIGNYDTKLPVEDAEGNVVVKTVTVPQYSYIYAKKASATGKHPYQFWFTQSAKIAWGANKCVIQSTERDRGLSDQNTFFAEDLNAVKQISVFGDWCSEADEVTGIDVIIVAGNGKDSEVIHSLNGVQLNSVPNKGIYIKNGNKYIAR